MCVQFARQFGTKETSLTMFCSLQAIYSRGQLHFLFGYYYNQTDNYIRRIKIIPKRITWQNKLHHRVANDMKLRAANKNIN